MSQSVKFKDGSYLDSSSIWDVASGQSQADINSGKQDALKVKDVELNAADYTYNTANGIYNANIALSTLLGDYTMVYSANIIYWANITDIPVVSMDGNASKLTLFSSTASPTFKYIVRFVYV